jgi:hypothetical protein
MLSTAHVDEEVHGKVVEVDLHGKLSREDYEMFVPEIERVIRTHGKARILVTMHDFQGWDAGALWEDFKWNARHFNHMEKLAIVGEPTWHRWMTSFCKPFTDTQVRYYSMDRLPEARAWLAEE